jgi:hypothetical protein
MGHVIIIITKRGSRSSFPVQNIDLYVEEEARKKNVHNISTHVSKSGGGGVIDGLDVGLAGK